MKEQYVRDISRFICYDLLKDPEIDISRDSALIESGIIDSFGIVQVVAFIEKEYGINLTDEDLMVENFRSISALAELIIRKNSQK